MSSCLRTIGNYNLVMGGGAFLTAFCKATEQAWVNFATYSSCPNYPTIEITECAAVEIHLDVQPISLIIA